MVFYLSAIHPTILVFYSSVRRNISLTSIKIKPSIFFSLKAMWEELEKQPYLLRVV